MSEKQVVIKVLRQDDQTSEPYEEEFKHYA